MLTKEMRAGKLKMYLHSCVVNKSGLSEAGTRRPRNMHSVMPVTMPTLTREPKTADYSFGIVSTTEIATTLTKEPAKKP